MSFLRQIAASSSVLAVTLIVGCGDDGVAADVGPDAAMDAAIDGASDGRVDAPPAQPISPRCMFPDPALDPDSVPSCEPSGAGATYVFVLDGMRLARPTAEGTLFGFDLDDRVSDVSDADTCFRQDLTSPPPESVPGIDSQINVAIVEAGLDDNFADSFTSNITAGQLIPLLVLEDVDDLVDDDCVQVSLVFGALPTGVAAPALSADGRYEPGQTFDVLSDWLLADRMTPRVRFLDGTLNGGTLTASALDAAVAISVPPEDVIAPLTIYGARLRVEVGVDGVSNGALGGALEIAQLVADLDGYVAEIWTTTLASIAYEQADLISVMGVCACITATVELDGTTAELGATVD